MYLGSDTVRLVVGRHYFTHPRQQEKNAVSILPEHRAAALAATSGQRGRNYLKREHLFALGPVVVDYLTEVVHRRPKLWVRDVNILHELLSLHGDDVLRAAIALAGERQTYGYEYVAQQLRDARAAAMNFDAEEVAQ